MSAIAVAERCHYCWRFRDPHEMRSIGESIKMCFQCCERHEKEVENFKVGTHCPKCNSSFESLRTMQGDAFRMFAHFIDGTYQALCSECDQIYVAQRKDLFGPTAFGYHERKL